MSHTPADPSNPDQIPEGYRLFPGHGPFADHVGPFVYRKTSEDSFLYGFQTRDHHANMNGVIHGGMLYAFADQFMGMSLAMKARKVSTTVTLNVEYVSAGKVGDWIEGEMEDIRLTRTLGFARARVFCGERILMTANGVFKLFQANG